jgi:hypothetical protein
VEELVSLLPEPVAKKSVGHTRLARSSMTDMIPAVLGTVVLLGAIGFIESGRKGRPRPLWHWLILAAGIAVLTVVVVICIGEYRFENGGHF